MMKWFALLLSLSLSSLLAGTSPSTSSPVVYTISGIDTGGVITQYTERYKALEATGAFVKVDGLCISACTLVLAIFPPSRICMTERASFGFHLASTDKPEPDLTRAWLRIFPEWVLKWIVDTGGLVETPRYMFAEDAKGHIPLCPGSHYLTVDMRKLITPEAPDNNRVIFRPQQ